MTEPDADRLRRQLGGADTEWIVQRLRQRMARGQPLTGTLSLGQPTPAQRLAVQRLLRRLSGTPAVAGRLAEDLIGVLALLPADGVPLARLAVLATGDAHALDADRPLATLVLSAVRATWWPGDDEPTSPAERRRALWDSAGVFVDELSSTVLVLNVTASPGSRLAALTALAARTGEPLVLTLRQLGRERLSLPAGDIHVCENPTVLAAAADQLGPACPPLVCLNGQPSTAALRLLTEFAAGGARLFYHGDFDWGGLRIANLLRSRVPWQPWRYDAAAYRAVVEDATPGTLTGRPVEAGWDAKLSEVMRRHGARVEEELVLDTLLADLAGH